MMIKCRTKIKHYNDKTTISDIKAGAFIMLNIRFKYSAIAISGCATELLKVI